MTAHNISDFLRSETKLENYSEYKERIRIFPYYENKKQGLYEFDISGCKGYSDPENFTLRILINNLNLTNYLQLDGTVHNLIKELKFVNNGDIIEHISDYNVKVGMLSDLHFYSKYFNENDIDKPKSDFEKVYVSGKEHILLPLNNGIEGEEKSILNKLIKFDRFDNNKSNINFNNGIMDFSVNSSFLFEINLYSNIFGKSIPPKEEFVPMHYFKYLKLIIILNPFAFFVPVIAQNFEGLNENIDIAIPLPIPEEFEFEYDKKKTQDIKGTKASDKTSNIQEFSVGEGFGEGVAVAAASSLLLQSQTIFSQVDLHETSSENIAVKKSLKRVLQDFAASNSNSNAILNNEIFSKKELFELNLDKMIIKSFVLEDDLPLNVLNDPGSAFNINQENNINRNITSRDITLDKNLKESNKILRSDVNSTLELQKAKQQQEYANSNFSIDKFNELDFIEKTRQIELVVDSYLSIINKSIVNSKEQIKVESKQYKKDNNINDPDFLSNLSDNLQSLHQLDNNETQKTKAILDIIVSSQEIGYNKVNKTLLEMSRIMNEAVNEVTRHNEFNVKELNIQNEGFNKILADQTISQELRLQTNNAKTRANNNYKTVLSENDKKIEELKLKTVKPINKLDEISKIILLAKKGKVEIDKIVGIDQIKINNLIKERVRDINNVDMEIDQIPQVQKEYVSEFEINNVLESDKLQIDNTNANDYRDSIFKQQEAISKTFVSNEQFDSSIRSFVKAYSIQNNINKAKVITLDGDLIRKLLLIPIKLRMGKTDYTMQANEITAAKELVSLINVIRYDLISLLSTGYSDAMEKAYPPVAKEYLFDNLIMYLDGLINSERSFDNLLSDMNKKHLIVEIKILLQTKLAASIDAKMLEISVPLLGRDILMVLQSDKFMLDLLGLIDTRIIINELIQNRSLVEYAGDIVGISDNEQFIKFNEKVSEVNFSDAERIAKENEYIKSNQTEEQRAVQLLENINRNLIPEKILRVDLIGLTSKAGIEERAAKILLRSKASEKLFLKTGQEITSNMFHDMLYYFGLINKVSSTIAIGYTLSQKFSDAKEQLDIFESIGTVGTYDLPTTADVRKQNIIDVTSRKLVDKITTVSIKPSVDVSPLVDVAPLVDKLPSVAVVKSIPIPVEVVDEIEIFPTVDINEVIPINVDDVQYDIFTETAKAVPSFMPRKPIVGDVKGISSRGNTDLDYLSIIEDFARSIDVHQKLVGGAY